MHVLGWSGVLRNAPKSCIHLRNFIFLSAVAVLVVSLSRRQMAKVVMGAKMKERGAVPSEANKACCRLDKQPYLRVLWGSKMRSHFQALST